MGEWHRGSGGWGGWACGDVQHYYEHDLLIPDDCFNGPAMQCVLRAERAAVQ